MFLELILSLNVPRTVGRRSDAVASARRSAAVATVNPPAIGMVTAVRGAGEWPEASDERGLGYGGEAGGKGVPGREDGRRKGGRPSAAASRPEIGGGAAMDKGQRVLLHGGAVWWREGALAAWSGAAAEGGGGAGRHKLATVRAARRSSCRAGWRRVRMRWWHGSERRGGVRSLAAAFQMTAVRIRGGTAVAARIQAAVARQHVGWRIGMSWRPVVPVHKGK